MNPVPRVLVLVGPTASGKTSVSIALAEELNGEIISADSRQIYKMMTIGTAKPSVALLNRIPHHCVDILTPDTEFTAGEFGKLGRKIIEDVLARGKTPIIIGGSGLYISSLIDGFHEVPPADKEFRKRMASRIAAGEMPLLLEELQRVDPLTAANIEAGKPRRVVRALEVFHLTGIPLSSLHERKRESLGVSPNVFGLTMERKFLYETINKRCDAMLREGLVDEVRDILRAGYDPSLNSLNTVGYREVIQFLQGSLSEEGMVRLFKQRSRQYAKRQWTWFKRDPRVQWISSHGRMVSDIRKEILSRVGAWK
jgi:tRNA dimethylallyltransferase